MANISHPTETILGTSKQYYCFGCIKKPNHLLSAQMISIILFTTLWNVAVSSGSISIVFQSSLLSMHTQHVHSPFHCISAIQSAWFLKHGLSLWETLLCLVLIDFPRSSVMRKHRWHQWDWVVKNPTRATQLAFFCMTANASTMVLSCPKPRSNLLFVWFARTCSWSLVISIARSWRQASLRLNFVPWWNRHSSNAKANLDRFLSSWWFARLPRP